jgi:hypothetical protein
LSTFPEVFLCYIDVWFLTYFKPKNSIATLVGQRTYPVAVIAIVEVDAMNSESEEDDLMDDDTTMDDGNAENLPTPAPKLKSTITNGPS